MATEPHCLNSCLLKTVSQRFMGFRKTTAKRSLFHRALFKGSIDFYLYVLSFLFFFDLTLKLSTISQRWPSWESCSPTRAWLYSFLHTFQLCAPCPTGQEMPICPQTFSILSHLSPRSTIQHAASANVQSGFLKAADTLSPSCLDTHLVSAEPIGML